MSTRMTAVIVAYHRPAALAGLIRQLGGGTDRTIVINVDGDEQVAEVAEAAGVESVPVANRGYGAAVNRGAALTDDELVVFMNDDISLRDGSLEPLRTALENGASAALPRVIDAEGRDGGSLLALPTPGRLLLEWALTPDHRPAWVPDLLARRVHKWRSREMPGRVSAGSAVLVAARRSVLTAQPLSDDYFLYWEELEWFWRLSQEDLGVQYVPESVVIHGGGRRDVRPEKCELLARNAVRCVRRTQGRGAAARAWPIVVIWWTRLWVTSLLRGRAVPAQAHAAARRAGLAAALTSWREIR